MNLIFKLEINHIIKKIVENKTVAVDTSMLNAVVCKPQSKDFGFKVQLGE